MKNIIYVIDSKQGSMFQLQIINFNSLAKQFFTSVYTSLTKHKIIVKETNKKSDINSIEDDFWLVSSYTIFHL